MSSIVDARLETRVRSCYFIDDDYRDFDRGSFGINRCDTVSMDPKQRMLLDVVYEAIETAGYSIYGLQRSNTGKFIGQTTDDYRDVLFHNLDDMPR